MYRVVSVGPFLACLIVTLVSACLLDDAKADAPQPSSGKVKAFILAGQSNMQGFGRVAMDPKQPDQQGTLEWLTKNPKHAAKFAPLLEGTGQWRTRDDVWITFGDRRGRLSAGYGVNSNSIGPELGFGWVMGEALADPVLLIKCAWGGKSLAKDFRPPSSGGEVGEYYKTILTDVRTVLSDLKTIAPELAGKDVQLVGFGWHQGWNDRVNQTYNDEYEKNMANFIRDIRRDLKSPGLPFVIAETGMAGPEENHPRALSLMRAQAAVATYPEFQGNVAFVGTKLFWRGKEASPVNQAYHWNHNAETYYLIGQAMGDAMKSLLSQPATATPVSPR